MYPDVGFLFRDSHHGNKSLVSLDEIGEGADALICLTNSLSCCEERDNETTDGMWYFPDLNHGSGHDVYITRGPGVVRLHRKRNSMLQAGLFHCEIPDARGMDQRIYIGVYPDTEGEGSESFH